MKLGRGGDGRSSGPLAGDNTPVDPQLPPTRHGRPSLSERWDLQRVLGSGGQAVVWLAHDRRLDQLVALKMFDGRLSAAGFRRLRREVLLGRELKHPNLVRIYELVEGNGCLAIAMEWLPGGNLKRWLAEGAIPIERVVKVTSETLFALAYLHVRGVIHRDVKPSNLLLDAEEKVKLGDFGLLRPIEEGSDATLTVGAVGTPPYMSPEQRRNEPLTPAADLYSLGATLYELLTGESLVSDDSDAQSMARRLIAHSPDPRRQRPDCPRWLARFVLRLLENKPADRFADGAAALAALRRHRTGVWPRYRRRVLTWAVAALLALATGAAAHRWLLPFLAPPAAVAFVPEGNALRALDRRGRTVWRYEAPSPIRQVERADALGDGSDEVIIAACEDSVRDRAKAPHPAEVAILSRTGRLLSLCRPEALVASEPALIAPPLLVPHVVLLDHGGAAQQEVVINCHHRSLGTAYLFAYDRGRNQWRLALDHSGGWIFDLAAVPGAGPLTLRFYAFNSFVGSLPVVGELTLGAPSGTGTRASPNLPGACAVNSTLRWYTVIEEHEPSPVDAVPGFQVLTDGSSLFATGGKRHQLDRFGNPVPGPNAGRDLSAMRLRFFESVGTLRTIGERQALGKVATLVAAIRRHASPLLAEPPVRAVLALVSARAMCAAGDGPAGVRALRSTWRELGYEGLGLGLAHAQALTGDLAGAAATLQQLNEGAHTPVGWFRAPELLTRVAIEARNRGLLDKATVMFLGEDASPHPARLLVARAHLWWDEAGPGDDDLPSLDTVPDGEAIACLARWRLGTTHPDDPERMRSAITHNPDAKGEGLVARAMALVALGRAAEALPELDRCEVTLAGTAATDFRAHQVWQLARACRAKALLAAGRREQALAIAAELHGTLRPGLLPHIVVEEVLRSTGGPAPGR